MPSTSSATRKGRVQPAWKRRLKAALGPGFVHRVNLLAACFGEMRKPVPPPTYPIPLEVLRDTLVAGGVEAGSVLHVQGSSSHLYRGWPVRTPDAALGGGEYGAAVLRLLLDLVGERGTIVMNTDFQRPKGWLTRLVVGRPIDADIFVPARDPSRRGVVSELFRQLPGSMRSIHPYYNVTARGPLAKELVGEHHLSTPYVQDRHSPWYKLITVGARVALLGRTFEVNSPIHLVEYLHPHEFPRPIFMQRPVTMYWEDSEGRHPIEVFLHASGAPGAPLFVPESLFKFSAYLQERYGIYRIRDFHGGTQVVTYDAREQYEAYLREMQAGVTWYDPEFLP
jgi:aminoglycoside N3'-acetyltransferase